MRASATRPAPRPAAARTRPSRGHQLIPAAPRGSPPEPVFGPWIVPTGPEMPGPASGGAPGGTTSAAPAAPVQPTTTAPPSTSPVRSFIVVVLTVTPVSPAPEASGVRVVVATPLSVLALSG